MVTIRQSLLLSTVVFSNEDYNPFGTELQSFQRRTE